MFLTVMQVWKKLYISRYHRNFREVGVASERVDHIMQ